MTFNLSHGYLDRSMSIGAGSERQARWQRECCISRVAEITEVF